MFDNQIYNFPIEKILEVLHAVKGHSNGMYFSPLRDEKTPSFHVDHIRNLWYDHGLGQGGTNVQLVQLYMHCSQKIAEDWIRNLTSTEIPDRKPAETESRQSSVEIVRIKELQMPFLTDYIKSRGITLETARKYCCEVMMTNRLNGRHYFVIGFLNNSQGLAMKSPYGYKSTTKAGITTISASGERSLVTESATVLVFEGFFDFLSLMALEGSEVPRSDAVILNSVNNISRAINYLKLHSRIETYLDNDNAGRDCLEKIRETLPDIVVVDRSELYHGYKDLNEFLIARKKER